MSELTIIQTAMVAVLFIWSGFVRSGLGFGGAALTLPVLLYIINNPLYWLPIIACHLLIFSGLTLYNRLGNVDWAFLKKAMLIMVLPKIAGVLGLLNLPEKYLLLMIYGITTVYGLTYVFNVTFKSNNRYVDRVLLIIGAYASGTSLIGAPLISAVFARHVEITRLRDTLFVLWFFLVVLKLSAFIAFDVGFHLKTMLVLIPFVTIGHFLGLKAHGHLIQGGGGHFKIMLGLVLTIISVYGLVSIINY